MGYWEKLDELHAEQSNRRAARFWLALAPAFGLFVWALTVWGAVGLMAG